MEMNHPLKSGTEILVNGWLRTRVLGNNTATIGDEEVHVYRIMHNTESSKTKANYHVNTGTSDITFPKQ